MRFLFGLASLALATGLLARTAGAQTPDGAEFLINMFTTGVQRPTSLSSASDGRFVVVWDSQSQDGSSYGVFARMFDGVGSPGPEFRVNQVVTNNQSGGAVGVASDGSFVVAWHSFNQDGNGFGVFGRRYDSAGTAQGVEFRVNTYTVGAQQRPSVASASNGSFVVAWESMSSQDGQSSGIFGQRYDASGNPLGGEFRINAFTTNAQQTARVASAADGRFVVIWESENEDGAPGFGVIGRRYDASGNPLSGDFQVNTYITNSQFYPAVSMTSDGRFVVVWASYLQDGASWGVFGQRYDASGTPLGVEFAVNAYTTSSQVRPSVAAADDGSFVVTWGSYGQENGSGVRGLQFDPQGNPIGAEFAVNTYSTGNQGVPFMSSIPNGAFVVVWRSNGQDGNSYGGFGQRYATSDLIFADGFEP